MSDLDTWLPNLMIIVLRCNQLGQPVYIFVAKHIVHSRSKTVYSLT